jgi:hypothetical protein
MACAPAPRRHRFTRHPVQQRFSSPPREGHGRGDGTRRQNNSLRPHREKATDAGTENVATAAPSVPTRAVPPHHPELIIRLIMGDAELISSVGRADSVLLRGRPAGQESPGHAGPGPSRATLARSGGPEVALAAHDRRRRSADPGTSPLLQRKGRGPGAEPPMLVFTENPSPLPLLQRRAGGRGRSPRCTCPRKSRRAALLLQRKGRGARGRSPRCTCPRRNPSRMHVPTENSSRRGRRSALAAGGSAVTSATQSRVVSLPSL